MPLAPWLAGAGAAILVESATHPLRNYLAAQYLWSDTARGYNAWTDSPYLVPTADTLLATDARMFGNTNPWIEWALRKHGVSLTGRIDPTGKADQGHNVPARRYLWRLVQEMQRSVPAPAVWSMMNARGFDLPSTFEEVCLRAGGSPALWRSAARFGLDRPTPTALWDAHVRGVFPDTVTFKSAFRRMGGDYEDYDLLRGMYRNMPGVVEAIEGWRRGKVDNDLFQQILKFHRLDSEELLPLWEELKKGIPGVTDLNMFGIRHSWQPELVEQYGYYLEFPERLRPWYAKLGLDYGVGFAANTDTGRREVTLADAYWASHWHVLPLASAFAAYQRFQPDLVRRFQEDNPALRPFTRDDLNVHMRQADFPPGVRDWLVALAHPVLGRRDIQWGAQFLGWDRGELQSRYRLLGYTTGDAAALATIAENRQTYREQAWIRSVETRAHQQTVRMIEGLYTDGTIDRAFAMRQLADAGLSAGLSTQLLDIADFGVERSLVRSAVSATSRDFLSGVLSRADAETQLRRIGIQDARIVNYLAAWSIQRSARRKRLETAKVAGMVTAGLLSADEARARLANLQWSDPDATLLLAEAEGKLARRLASEQKSAATDARQRAKELERLARDAESQSKKLRSEANRVAPRSVLTTWRREGQIDDDTFRSMMKERGYDSPDIERYLADAKRDKPRPPRPSPTSPPWPRPSGSAHPAQARLLKWYNDGVISLEDYRDGLTDLGYAPGDVARFVRDASPTANGQAARPSSGEAPPQA
jgi:hypothetical protein